MRTDARAKGWLLKRLALAFAVDPPNGVGTIDESAKVCCAKLAL
jgi:hypothetical protein